MTIYRLFSLIPGRLEYEKGKKPILFNPTKDPEKGDRYFAEVEALTLSIRKLQRKGFLVIESAPSDEEIFAPATAKPAAPVKTAPASPTAAAKVPEPEAAKPTPAPLKNQEPPQESEVLAAGSPAGTGSVPSDYDEAAAIASTAHEIEDDFLALIDGKDPGASIPAEAMSRIRDLMSSSYSLDDLKDLQKTTGGRARSRHTIVAGLVGKEHRISGLVIRPSPTTE